KPECTNLLPPNLPHLHPRHRIIPNDFGFLQAEKGNADPAVGGIDAQGGEAVSSLVNALPKGYGLYILPTQHHILAAKNAAANLQSIGRHIQAETAAKQAGRKRYIEWPEQEPKCIAAPEIIEQRKK